jgi:hypothetical protein
MIWAICQIEGFSKNPVQAEVKLIEVITGVFTSDFFLSLLQLANNAMLSNKAETKYSFFIE